MRDLVLVGSVVVHYPDFFVPAAAADEKNLALGNARNTPAQPKNYLVRKFVSDGASRIAGRRILVLLAQNLR